MIAAQDATELASHHLYGYHHLPLAQHHLFTFLAHVTLVDIRKRASSTLTTLSPYSVTYLPAFLNCRRCIISVAFVTTGLERRYYFARLTSFAAMLLSPPSTNNAPLFCCDATSCGAVVHRISSLY